MTIKIKQLDLQPDETSRLAELYGLQVLDTPPEERFDQYTELVAAMFDVPIALISMMDVDRQWFKSAVGVEVAEAPREFSFATHAPAGEDVFVVPNAMHDERFADNPMVRGEPGIRFYAGAVIRGPTGKTVGTLCVLDLEPRELTPSQVKALTIVSRLVEQELNHGPRAENAELLIDSNTGLPNLNAFNAQLRRTLALASESSECLLLVLLRIDRFEALDAALGSRGSASIVTSLASRIQDEIPRVSFIGRIREDKLGIVVALEGPEDPKSILDRLMQCASQPFTLGDHMANIKVLAGASQYPKDAKTMESLLKRARTAQWSIPLSGESDYRLYQRHYSNEASRLFKLESALRQAVENREFRLVYQPKVDLRANRIVGCEALLRWDSKEFGSVPPNVFIPVAESCGIIERIGDWVLRTAADKIGDWAQRGIVASVAVNVASQQLRQVDFYDRIQALIGNSSALRENLNLELTESSLVDDIDATIQLMRGLRELGVSFSIDDFGTGFSSLSYLRSMPVGYLKIDRAFVCNIPTSESDRRLVRSIVSMAHDLGLRVVAEGVENEDQLEFLRSVSCDEVQGYVYAKPMSADEYEGFVADWQKRASRPAVGRDGKHLSANVRT